jgi:O-acetyl-ADP-ribose deacetylase (regulator of RNase III)
VKLHLVDENSLLVAAWKEAFLQFPEVHIAQGDILAVAENTVVSPANSFGFMDGGVDAAYLRFFGASIQSKVHAAIGHRPEGHLPVGASVIIRTGNARVPFMIIAPTMLHPESVQAEHAYRAMRTVLRIAETDSEVGSRIFCPGLATGVGLVAPADAAQKMAEAYRDWILTR